MSLCQESLRVRSAMAGQLAENGKNHYRPVLGWLSGWPTSRPSSRPSPVTSPSEMGRGNGASSASGKTPQAATGPFPAPRLGASLLRIRDEHAPARGRLRSLCGE